MRTEYSNWRKLDNAALAFPLVTGENDTRVFRFYCQLKEEVDSDILQQALDRTMEKYPLFQAVLRKGLFWFYLEHSHIRALVKPETEPPCSRLYIPDKKSLLFQVSYYKERINFEVFHALTDGTGAMHFLQELVQNYLILAHPKENFPEIGRDKKTGRGNVEEDSFSQYYSSDIPKNREKKKAAVKLKGEKLVHSDMHISEVVLSVKEVHQKARSYGVSITVLLTAVMLCSIREEIPKNQQKRPVTLMIPVNLRNYFPSQSMTNFFGWIEVGYTFSDTTTFEEVLADVKRQFEQELEKDKIAMHMNDYVRIEKNIFVRAVPLEIKKYFLMIGANLGSRSITAVYSNIGIIRLPEEYREYIRHFGIFASTNSLQMCSCSYGDEMVLGFTSKIPDDSILQKKTAVIFNFGVNDLKKYKKYASYYNLIEPILTSKGCELYFMSVNPINRKMLSNADRADRSEAELRRMNDYLRENLSSAYTYIDMYSYLKSTGYSFSSDHYGAGTIDDGLHYTAATYKRIYARCLDSLKRR